MTCIYPDIWTLMRFSATFPWKTWNLPKPFIPVYPTFNFFQLLAMPPPTHCMSVPFLPFFCLPLSSFQALFISFSPQLSIAFLALPISHSPSICLSPSPLKQWLSDGFPITAGTEGPGWLPHVNVWAPALNISSTHIGEEGGLEKQGDEAEVKETHIAKRYVL